MATTTMEKTGSGLPENKSLEDIFSKKEKKKLMKEFEKQYFA